MPRELGTKRIETVFGSNANTVLIGDPGTGNWVAVAHVRYPHAKTMFETVSTDAYRSIQFHRKVGLEEQMLIRCDSKGVF